jgi:hypothetical protein
MLILVTVVANGLRLIYEELAKRPHYTASRFTRGPQGSTLTAASLTAQLDDDRTDTASFAEMSTGAQHVVQDVQWLELTPGLIALPGEDRAGWHTWPHPVSDGNVMPTSMATPGGRPRDHAVGGIVIPNLPPEEFD